MLIRTSWSPTMKLWGFIILVVGALLMVIFMRPIMSPLIISAILAYLLDPLVRLVKRLTKLTREWSAWIVFWLFILTLVLILVLAGSVLVDQIRNIRSDLLTAINALQNWISQPFDIGGYRIHPQVGIENITRVVAEALSTIPRGSMNILSDISTSLFGSVMVFVTLYYFLKDAPRIKSRLISFVAIEYRTDIERLLAEIDGVWKVFLRVQLLIFFVLAVLMALGTFLVIWLFRSGLLSFSPLLFLVLLIIVYAAAQQVDNLWLRPQLMGKQLQLHPGIVFAALAGGLMVSGFLGAIIIVPAIATMKVVGRYTYCQLFDIPPWAEEVEETNGHDLRIESGMDLRDTSQDFNQPDTQSKQKGGEDTEEGKDN